MGPDCHPPASHGAPPWGWPGGGVASSAGRDSETANCGPWTSSRGTGPAKGAHPAANLAHSPSHPHSARRRCTRGPGTVCPVPSRWEQEAHGDRFGALREGSRERSSWPLGVSGSRLNLGPQGQGQGQWGWRARRDRAGRGDGMALAPPRPEEIPLTFKGRGRAPMPTGASRGQDESPVLWRQMSAGEVLKASPRQ